MPVRGKITAAALGSLLAAGVPSGVASAQPGVTVDPQSPAGVEYAIPLNSGRGHGGGGGHGHPGGGSGANGGSGSGSGGGSTLFGAGITPSGSGGPGARAPGTSPGHGGSGGSGGAGASGPVKKQRGSTARRNASPTGLAPVSAAASYSTSGPIAGIVAAILVLGGGLGLLVRFRSRRTAGDKPLR